MLNKVQKVLQQFNNQNTIAGFSVGITDTKNTLAVFNFGVESTLTNQPITNQTQFRIASITKIVTGLTVMCLIAQGKISLTDKVGKYVSWLSPKIADLSLHSILSHTSGLPKEYTPKGPTDESLLEDSLKNELGKIDLESVGNGSPFLYSNLGIRLATLIVEKVTGERFSAVSHRLVIDKLGMGDTFYSLDKALTKPLALPHKVDNDKVYPVEMWENAVRLGAGGLFSTSTDLCKLARFLLNKGVTDSNDRILDQSLIDDMITAKVKRVTGDYYGYTIMIHNYDDRLVYGHLGSAPPYCANLVVDYKSGYGIALLINTAGNESLREKITDAVFDCLTK